MKVKKISILLLVLVMMTNLIACNNTSYEDAMNVIEVEAAAEAFLNGDAIFVDARGEEAYNEAHIKGAICLAPSDLVVDKPVAATVAPKAKVERVLSAKGIANDSTVYIYDESAGVYAFRVWWTMKLYGHENVKVINGGFDALWSATDSGLSGSTSATELAPTEYVAQEVNEAMIIGFEDVKAITEDPDSEVKIIDVRSVAEYDAGSIPGATLYPHSNNLYTDGTFMSARDMYLFYNDKGFEKDDELVLYCKSSFRATQTMALLEEAGYTNIKIYDGAWLEWEAMGGESNTVEDDAPVTQQDGS